GVMGYEGHIVGVAERTRRVEMIEPAMAALMAAHDDVGGDLVSAGGTGTFDINTWATEIQAGSYALMDTAYAGLGLPFAQALHVEATVISVSAGWAVADCGLKALAMDHGDPTIDGSEVWFCSDEHVTFKPGRPVVVGDRVRVTPAHVDPTVAKHERIHVIDGDDVLEIWPVDLRGW
ncbi:MAG TPA: metal-activated pyridoxal enzyme, partial [Acidimicrobiales bacterium]